MACSGCTERRRRSPRAAIKRLPVRDYLLKQGRFAHFIDEDIEYFQSKIDQMWEKWLIPGVIPFRTELDKEVTSQRSCADENERPLRLPPSGLFIYADTADGLRSDRR